MPGGLHLTWHAGHLTRLTPHTTFSHHLHLIFSCRSCDESLASPRQGRDNMWTGRRREEEADKAAGLRFEIMFQFMFCWPKVLNPNLATSMAALIQFWYLKTFPALCLLMPAEVRVGRERLPWWVTDTLKQFSWTVTSISPLYAAYISSIFTLLTCPADDLGNLPPSQYLHKSPNSW